MGIHMRKGTSKQAAVISHATDEKDQLRDVLKALRAVRDGDFSVRLPGDWTGLEAILFS